MSCSAAERLNVFTYWKQVLLETSIVRNRFHKTAEFQDILPRLTLEKEANRWKIAKNGYLCDCLLPWQQSAIYSYERKWNPRCVANLHCECQELKPKVETNTSFLVLHPSSGVDTVKTVGSHLNGIQAKTTPKKGPSPQRACSQVRRLARIWIVAIQNLLHCRACSNEQYVRQQVKKNSSISGCPQDTLTSIWVKPVAGYPITQLRGLLVHDNQPALFLELRLSMQPSTQIEIYAFSSKGLKTENMTKLFFLSLEYINIQSILSWSFLLRQILHRPIQETNLVLTITMSQLWDYKSPIMNKHV